MSQFSDLSDAILKAGVEHTRAELKRMRALKARPEFKALVVDISQMLSSSGLNRQELGDLLQEVHRRLSNGA